MTSWATLGGVQGSPDWVMVGTQNSRGGVTVFASTEMTSAELRVEVESWTDPYEFTYTRRYGDPTRRFYVLTANMRTIVAAQGADYPDAIRQLFEFWQPTRSSPPDQAGLPAPRREIESRPTKERT